MHDELTKIDIQKMKEELEERAKKVPALRDEVKRTKEYGDLSENDEYRCAKREYNRNKSRMQYLENMINTAVIIDTKSEDGTVGLFDDVTVFYPDDGTEDTLRIVTTLRNDIFSKNISKESPFGKAILGRKVGDRVIVHVNDKISYPVEIKSIKKGEDDASLPISKF